MQFIFSTSHVHTFFMHTSFLSFLFLWFLVVIVFCLSWIDYAMAPKACKSTSGRNPLQGFGSSFDSFPLLHVRFHDKKARKDFSENFQKHGVHPESHVILSDFFNTLLPGVIRT